MTQAEIINIWRDLILKAWLLGTPTPKQKEKFLKLLNFYEAKLTGDSSQYKSIILWFIKDIRWDIEMWRQINIDNIQDDEYVTNYFITKYELDNFNKLIDAESFKNIFTELQKKNYNKEKVVDAVQKIDAQFRVHFKKLSKKNISKNLLIFTQFERTLPIPALNRLIEFISHHDSLQNEILIINRLERIYKDFLRNFYKECLICLKSKKINSKFIRFSQRDWRLSLHLECEDASSFWLRSGDPIFEYEQLLKKMW